jgi:hypothetical protein
MTTMRAKVRVSAVTVNKDADGNTTSERVHFSGVARSNGYPADGSDEDNSFAKFSPSVEMSFTIANPALFGKFMSDKRFYADFTPAD